MCTFDQDADPPEIKRPRPSAYILWADFYDARCWYGLASYRMSAIGIVRLLRGEGRMNDEKRIFCKAQNGSQTEKRILHD